MAELHWWCQAQREFHVQQATEEGELFEPVARVNLLELNAGSVGRVVWWGPSFIRPWRHPEGKYDPPNWVLKWWSDE